MAVSQSMIRSDPDSLADMRVIAEAILNLPDPTSAKNCRPAVTSSPAVR
jgi:hypothetical protein